MVLQITLKIISQALKEAKVQLSMLGTTRATVIFVIIFEPNFTVISNFEMAKLQKYFKYTYDILHIFISDVWQHVLKI